MTNITIYTDGGARGNPGPAGIGAVLFDEQKNVLKEVSAYIGSATNNFAEYEALIQALQAAHELCGEKISETQILIKMDSELIVRQMEGKYKVKEPTLKEQFARVGQLIGGLSRISFAHVPREENAHADRLVNEAIDKALT